MKLTLLEYFEQDTLTGAPSKTAVIDGERSLTMAQLAQAAKRLAAVIISKLDRINGPIGIFLPKSIESVVADMAVSYSGNAYMNLDIKYPDQRISNIFEKIRPVIIITNTAFFARITGLCHNGEIIINIDEAGNEAYDEALIFQRLTRIIDTDPYCIINTSGSTGTPKGVALNHKSFVDFTEWAIPTLQLKDEVIGSLSPLFFDIYSFELCMMMALGATIVIIPETAAIFPAKLVELLVHRKVTYIFWVPTIMVNIANMDILSSYSLPDLKKIWFAGEVFPTKHMNYWRGKVPQAMFVNLYGPIEITLDCTYYIVDRDIPNDEPIPIGYPCRNTDVLILDMDDKPAGVNEKGELCVRGTSLAMGYWNDPEKTAKAFVQNPLNKNYPELIYRTGDVVYKDAEGKIMFTGRKDFQVKHLGYRIDLSEIEHIIVNTLAHIDNACVLYHFNNKEICLFYEGAQEISAADFRTALSAHLPKYMIPSKFYVFQELPRNPNGKIDRNLLKEQLAVL